MVTFLTLLTAPLNGTVCADEAMKDISVVAQLDLLWYDQGDHAGRTQSGSR